ncbi:MAG: FAD:protein FMN transferase [Alistipes sp.]|nr:FAD:protein FMN transferase [Alistipes sp.]
MEFRFSDKNPLHPISLFSFDAMHTRIEVLLTGIGESAGRSLAERVEQECRQMEHRFNCHDLKSPLAVVNSLAAERKVEVDDELFMALELCEVFRRGTAGYFDIATDSARAGERSYQLDAKAHTVSLSREGIRLDMGGFAKGFALERIRKMLAEEGVETALMNFGNSSVAALGHHPYGEWWAVGVEHTKVRGSMAYEVHLDGGAMSVSGRSTDGRYHIVNPATGGTVAAEELILVEGRSALVVEVLSTALYAAPRAQRGAIIGQYDGYRATEIYCRAGGGVELREIGK